MTLTSCLYLVEVISNIDIILGGLISLSALCFIVPTVIWIISIIVEDEHVYESISKLFKLYYKKAWLFIILIALNVIIPNKKTMYLMLGTHYLSQSGITTKVLQALELKPDNAIEELKPKESDDGQGKMGQTEEIEATQA